VESILPGTLALAIDHQAWESATTPHGLEAGRTREYSLLLVEAVEVLAKAERLMERAARRIDVEANKTK
jgi:hypothetical protein